MGGEALRRRGRRASESRPRRPSGPEVLAPLRVGDDDPPLGQGRSVFLAHGHLLRVHRSFICVHFTPSSPPRGLLARDRPTRPPLGPRRAQNVDFSSTSGASAPGWTKLAYNQEPAGFSRSVIAVVVQQPAPEPTAVTGARTGQHNGGVTDTETARETAPAYDVARVRSHFPQLREGGGAEPPTSTGPAAPRRRTSWPGRSTTRSSRRWPTPTP